MLPRCRIEEQSCSLGREAIGVGVRWRGRRKKKNICGQRYRLRGSHDACAGKSRFAKRGEVWWTAACRECSVRGSVHTVTTSGGR